MDLLQVEQLTVAFGGREVVHGLDFSIQAEEKLALVGESGSGKSVTALSLLGLAQGATVSGRVLWQGTDLLRLTAQRMRAVRGSEIGMVFQEPMTALNPLFSVGDQIAEVLELKQGHTPRQAQHETVQWLERTGLDEPDRRAKQYPHQLSGGQRQRVLIAMALAARPKLLLADEPTTALDLSLRGQILDLLSQAQRDYGMAVILITHDLPMVRLFADRVLVLEQGRCVEQGVVNQVLRQPQHPYTRRLVDSVTPRDIRPPADDETLVRASQLSAYYDVPRPGWRGWLKARRFCALDGVGFELKRGQTLGIVGESGSGKSTLSLALLGLHPHGGDLSLWHQHWRGEIKHDLALRRRIQVVFQDPFSSLSPRLTVGQIVAEGLLVHHPHLSPAQRTEQTIAALAEVGLDDARFEGLLQRYPHEFSGGQRQRLAIARALIVGPEILVLDEPTSALDVSIQRQVLELLQQLQKKKSLTYLLITHDWSVLRAMAHQVLVLRQGRVVEHGSAAQIFNQAQDLYTQTLLRLSQTETSQTGLAIPPI